MQTDFCLYPRDYRREDVYRNLTAMSEVFQRHYVTIAFLFGSIMYGETSNDMDIGVFFKEKKKSNIDLYTDIYFDLCPIFSADNIDVVILNDTGPAFRFEVISKGEVVYYEDPGEVADFYETTLFEYQETSGFRRESHEELVQSVREGLMRERKIHRQRVDTFERI